MTFLQMHHGKRFHVDHMVLKRPDLLQPGHPSIPRHSCPLARTSFSPLVFKIVLFAPASHSKHTAHFLFSRSFPQRIIVRWDPNHRHEDGVSCHTHWTTPLVCAAVFPTVFDAFVLCCSLLPLKTAWSMSSSKRHLLASWWRKWCKIESFLC